MAKVNFTLSLDTVRDERILTKIEWLKTNKHNVSGWLREMIYSGMDGKTSLSRLEQKLDALIERVESGVMVSSAPSTEAPPRRKVPALDNLGL